MTNGDYDQMCWLGVAMDRRHPGAWNRTWNRRRKGDMLFEPTMFTRLMGRAILNAIDHIGTTKEEPMKLFKDQFSYGFNQVVKVTATDDDILAAAKAIEARNAEHCRKFAIYEAEKAAAAKEAALKAERDEYAIQYAADYNGRNNTYFAVNTFRAASNRLFDLTKRIEKLEQQPAATIAQWNGIKP